MRYSACLASFAHDPTIVRLFIHPMVMMIEVYFLAIHVLTENIIFGCWDYTKPFISAIVHVPSSKAMTILMLDSPVGPERIRPFSHLTPYAKRLVEIVSYASRPTSWCELIQREAFGRGRRPTLANIAR